MYFSSRDCAIADFRCLDRLRFTLDEQTQSDTICWFSLCVKGSSWCLHRLRHGSGFTTRYMRVYFYTSDLFSSILYVLLHWLCAGDLLYLNASCVDTMSTKSAHFENAVYIHAGHQSQLRNFDDLMLSVIQTQCLWVLSLIFYCFQFYSSVFFRCWALVIRFIYSEKLSFPETLSFKVLHSFSEKLRCSVGKFCKKTSNLQIYPLCRPFPKSSVFWMAGSHF